MGRRAKSGRIALAAVGALLCMPIAAQAASVPKAGALTDGPSGRFTLNGKWYDRSDPQDNGVQQGFQKQTDTNGWSTTNVPDASNAGDFTVASYTGQVHWYRKDFKLPKGNASEWLLHFESVNYRAKAWLNGKPIGFHVGAELPFELRAKGVRKGVNRLVVQVDSRRQPFDIPPLDQRSTGNFVGGWWNYNGILRDVSLRRVDRLDAEQVLTQPSVRCRNGKHCKASVRVMVKVRNHAGNAQSANVSGAFGSQGLDFKRAKRIGGKGGSKTFVASMKVRNPKLWTPQNPNLYHLRVNVRAGGSVVQTYDAHPGLRSWGVSRLGRIQLNGRDVNLRGASFHEDSPDRGSALSPEDFRKIFLQLRQLGANMTRSHYPLNPYALELADKYGIVVWSEIPVYRMESRLFNSSTVRAKALRMLREEIVADYNHPSVAVWSIGNENPSRPKSGFQTYLTHADNMVKKLDPTRLIGIAISGYPTVAKQRIYTKLDVIGINDYFGWYDGPHGSISDRNQLSGYLNRMHSDYPNQAFVITEFGAEANRNGPVTEKGTYQFQADFLKFHLDVFASKPFVNGALVWNLRDFRVKPGWEGGNPFPHPPVNEKGMIDDAGHYKPSFFTVRDEFKKTPLYGRRACC